MLVGPTVSGGKEQMKPCDFKQGQDSKKVARSRDLGRIQGIGLVGDWLWEGMHAQGEDDAFSQQENSK